MINLIYIIINKDNMLKDMKINNNNINLKKINYIKLYLRKIKILIIDLYFIIIRIQHKYW